MKLEFKLRGFILTHLLKNYPEESHVNPWIPTKTNEDFEDHLMGFTTNTLKNLSEDTKYLPYKLKKL
jgi:hypothetical protein